jgi:hypothetical protein
MAAKIAAALHAVMSKVTYVQKQGKNDFHGYKYASEADLLEKLRPAMVEEGLMLIPSIENVSEIDQHGNTMVMVNYTLVHKSGEIWPHPIKAGGCGNDRNKNGVGDKGLYKALTGANKYLLFKLFQIETGDDPENDAAQQASIAQAHETYITLAKTAMGLQETVEDLNAWWKGEAPNREKIGILNTTEAYKTLTAMAAARSKQLKEKSNV